MLNHLISSRSVSKAVIGGVLLCLSCSVLANDFSWKGSYEFDESGANATGTRSYVISHHIDIKKQGDVFSAIYWVEENARRLAVDERWIGDVQGDKLVLRYDRCITKNCTNHHKKGAAMLELAARSDDKGEFKLLSFWKGFKPGDPSWFKSGRTHFEKQK